jgi:hypothetical protein
MRCLWIVIVGALITAAIAGSIAAMQQAQQQAAKAAVIELDNAKIQMELKTHIQWYAGDTNFTQCIESPGPGKKILEIRDSLREPEVKDDGDTVEVSVGEGLNTRFWTYYASMELCNAALEQRSSVPDRYFSR